PTAVNLEFGLRGLMGDGDVNQLRRSIFERNCVDFEVFLEHPISVPIKAKGVEVSVDGGCVNLDSDAETKSSSNDNYESAEDEAYKPPPEGYELSSDSDSGRRRTAKKGTRTKKIMTPTKKGTVNANFGAEVAKESARNEKIAKKSLKVKSIAYAATDGRNGVNFDAVNATLLPADIRIGVNSATLWWLVSFRCQSIQSGIGSAHRDRERPESSTRYFQTWLHLCNTFLTKFGTVPLTGLWALVPNRGMQKCTINQWVLCQHLKFHMQIPIVRDIILTAAMTDISVVKRFELQRSQKKLDSQSAATIRLASQVLQNDSIQDVPMKNTLNDVTLRSGTQLKGPTLPAQVAEPLLQNTQTPEIIEIGKRSEAAHEGNDKPVPSETSCLPYPITAKRTKKVKVTDE
ncbi:hypothetical protein PIB30_084509, partial [Stylosanthes scabra]|nr:hypothetical protein [Stylosanthes scabra]